VLKAFAAFGEKEAPQPRISRPTATSRRPFSAADYLATRILAHTSSIPAT
jgi:hypothetical protein